MGDLRLVMLITVIWPLNIGGYSGLGFGTYSPWKWTAHHAAEKDKTIGSRDRCWYLL